MCESKASSEATEALRPMVVLDTAAALGGDSNDGQEWKILSAFGAGTFPRIPLAGRGMVQIQVRSSSSVVELRTCARLPGASLLVPGRE